MVGDVVRDGTHEVNEEHTARLAHRSELFGAKRPSALLKDVVAQLGVRSNHRRLERFACLLELLGFRWVDPLLSGSGVQGRPVLLIAEPVLTAADETGWPLRAVPWDRV